MFEDLTLVILGPMGAGKNYVGNKIIGKDVFRPTWRAKWNKTSVKEERKFSVGKITVYRTPGWSGDLSTSTVKDKIKSCV